MPARGVDRGRERPLAAAAGAGGNPIRAAVVGAGRARQGTGPFVTRRLLERGVAVVAVATSTTATAAQAAAGVSALSGRRCAPFTSVGTMLDSTDLDAVAICSPAPAHAEHLQLALQRGLDTFCEKPLLDVISDPTALDRAARIVGGFIERQLVLHVNTQWTHTLDHLRTLYGLDELPPLRVLRVELQPPVIGPAMVTEAAPHANSMLLALQPNGTATGLSARLSAGQDELEVDFTWNATSADGTSTPGAEVAYAFRWQADQPRAAAFEVNGMRVERTVDMTHGYEILFRGNGRAVPATDPLADSVQAFVDAVCTRSVPSGAILRNLELMVDIADELETPPAAPPGPVPAGLASRSG